MKRAEKEITLSVPVSCLSMLRHAMSRRIGEKEYYERIGMNEDTFNDFPASIQHSYLWDLSCQDMEFSSFKGISEKLFFNIIGKTRAPSLVANVIIKFGYKYLHQVTLEGVQRLVNIKYKRGSARVFEVLAAHIKKEYVPLLLKVPEAAPFVEKRLKGKV